jgi:hypothetical protein
MQGGSQKAKPTVQLARRTAILDANQNTEDKEAIRE